MNKNSQQLELLVANGKVNGVHSAPISAKDVIITVEVIGDVLTFRVDSFNNLPFWLEFAFTSEALQKVIEFAKTRERD